MRSLSRNKGLAIATAAAAAFVGAAAPAIAQSAPMKPNVVHIVADDLGWKDVGFNGATDIKTPNLDKLAAEGAKFTQFYAQPMSTPTRAALMTGRYPFRYGLQTAVIPGPATYGLNTDEYLLPQVLKDAGYKTAIIGKWHLGHADKKFWPKQRGFDYQYGAMIGELDYFTHSDAGVRDWFRDNEVVKEKGYTTQLIGDDAVKYVEAQDGKTPFYLYLTFNAPHTPYQVPESYKAKYADIKEPTRRTYAGMVDCLDENIGRVVQALDKKGLRKNTLILFHSDNGGVRNAMFAGQMTDLSKTVLPCDNGPYRDGKGTYFEGGVRVAALANWPGQIKPQEVTGLIHVTDIMPTITALAGGSTTKCKPIDGMNVWNVIAENKPSPRKEILLGVESFRAAIRDGDFKLIVRPLLPSSVDLYNIVEDPYEKKNIADAHPEKVAAMRARIEAVAKEAAPAFFLKYVGSAATAHGTPNLAGSGPAPAQHPNHSVTDEGFGDFETKPDPASAGH